MGWAATFGSLALPALLLYAGAVFWTMGYDTIYAIQDFDDDGVAGIRSTARLFGDSSRMAIGLFYALAVVAVGGSVLAAGLGLAAWLGVAAFAAHLGWQVGKVRLDDKRGALLLFRANRDAGILLFGGLFVEAAARSL
jgi:4-hydroxybenzoate polyprenyltransferase